MAVQVSVDPNKPQIADLSEAASGSTPTPYGATMIAAEYGKKLIRLNRVLNGISEGTTNCSNGVRGALARFGWGDSHLQMGVNTFILQMFKKASFLKECRSVRASDFLGTNTAAHREDRVAFQSSSICLPIYPSRSYAATTTTSG